MSIIRQPEFRVPLDRAVPGMVLSRNLEHGGQMLLRYGSQLDQDRILKLGQLGVTHVYVHFENQDLAFYKDLLISQDNPPSYEKLVDLSREAFHELIPPYARPQHCARTPQVAQVVDEVIENTFDVIFSSRRVFELFRLTRYFQIAVLRHCPAAWVYALCIGAGMDYNLPVLLELSLSALFYDIGMLKVPGRIINKPGRLTELEFAEVKKHVFFSRKMLEGLGDFSSTAAAVAFQHHEHYYGGGYPKNRRGDDIHEFSQIVALTDKFSAMITPKCYRDSFQPYQAYEMLLAQTKSSVSPKVFVAFLKNVLLYPRGSMFRLSTGEIAEPVDFPLHMPTRPSVRITHAPQGGEVMGVRKKLDLMDHPEIAIEGFAIVEEGYGATPPTDGVQRGLLGF